MNKNKLILYIIMAVIFVGFGLIFSGEDRTDSLAPASVLTAPEFSENQNGLQIKDIITGSGAEAKNGDLLTVNYVGALLDGVKFDSSYDRNQPFQFTLGAGQVIKGWDLGVLGMKVGGKRKLVIPSEFGYGSQAVGTIPPNSTLIFEVELLEVRTE
ncbi:MAG: FKBP-type peptidyl-prolyl cis-trans isomerase [bacterium]|nr:FKBP-type peptidyl-prolyl cis-trans isomerase [bacterium]